MQVVLGFDYGTHKIGVAVGQALTGSATPLETLGMVKNKPDWQRIEQLLAEWKPEALVVGHPFEMTDREAWARLGSAAGRDPTRVDAFAAKLILETWLNE